MYCSESASLPIPDTWGGGAALEARAGGKGAGWGANIASSTPSSETYHCFVLSSQSRSVRTLPKTFNSPPTRKSRQSTRPATPPRRMVSWDAGRMPTPNPPPGKAEGFGSRWRFSTFE